MLSYAIAALVSNAHFSTCPNTWYQMYLSNVSHCSCVISFTNITMFPYSEQIQDIELYGTSVGDDLVAKWTNSSKRNFFLWTLGTLNNTVEMILMLKWTISNISNGYSMYIDYKLKIWCIVIINYFSKP